MQCNRRGSARGMAKVVMLTQEEYWQNEAIFECLSKSTEGKGPNRSARGWQYLLHCSSKAQVASDVRRKRAPAAWDRGGAHTNDPVPYWNRYSTGVEYFTVYC